MSEQLSNNSTEPIDLQPGTATTFQEQPSTKTGTMTTTTTMLDEEALAEHSKKLPFILSSTRKQQHHQHSLSNSSSFDGDFNSILDGTTTTIENEYGQVPLGRIHGIHKKGTPTQHRLLHGTSNSSMDGNLSDNSSTAAAAVGAAMPDELKTPTTTRKTLTMTSHTSRSRSCSPSIGRSGGAVSATIASTMMMTTTGNTTVATNSNIPTLMHSVMTDGNSSISSMDDYECDLYTDRAGMMDDLSESQRKLHSSKDLHLPSTVLERMCEDSLEDNHAFTDIVVVGRSSSRRNTTNNPIGGSGSSSSIDRDRGGDETGTFSSNASRVSHVSGSNAGDGMLEPLDECDEGLENDSLEDSVTDQQNYGMVDGFGTMDPTTMGSNPLTDGNVNVTGGMMDAQQQQQTVILTNMENLTLESANNNDRIQLGGGTGYSSQAGSVSYIAESSSVGGVAGGGATLSATTSNVGDTSDK